MHVFYLHGFASSAGSTKAAFFATKLRQRGLTLHTPDFNQPDFSSLTVSRMIDQTLSAVASLPQGPVVLIGSSLGAFVAVQVALRLTGSTTHPVERMILLAPALDFSGNRTRNLGDRGLDEWQSTGILNVFHYGYGRIMPVGYELFADARGYDCINAHLMMPIQIFQGTRDTAVDPRSVEQWAQSRPNVELHLLDDDHQLASSLEGIWRAVEGKLR
jgi:pimeloyl-ACP methyl ester carboxylesterase